MNANALQMLNINASIILTALNSSIYFVQHAYIYNLLCYITLLHNF